MAFFWVLEPILSKVAKSYKISKNSRLTRFGEQSAPASMKGEGK